MPRLAPVPRFVSHASSRRTLARRPSLVAVAFLVGAATAPCAASLGAQPTTVAATASSAARGVSLSPRDRWADSARRLLDRAVPAGDRAGLDAAHALLERALVAMPDDPLLLHYAGYAEYRAALLLLAGRDAAEQRGAVRERLERADSLLQRSAARLPLAETFALRSSVLGMQIATSRNPAAGMLLGPRASAAMDEAERRGPRNPRVALLRGISAFNTPRMWGGGAERARTYLAEAVARFATDRPAAPLPSWGAGEAHLWLGRAHLALGRPDSARAAYRQAAALESENQWLTRVLIPEAEREAATRAGGR